MRFNLIKEPDENPIDLLNSYRQQNILMQKIRVLHTAFDGIKLTNWSDSNRELPNILIGSVCEFGGRLFEAEDNIILSDNDDSDGKRYIRLEIVRENPASDSDNDYLIAEVVNHNMPDYDYDNRGFYSKDSDGIIKYKYLRLEMTYSKSSGGYIEKKYWNISDLMRAGSTFKKYSQTFGVGEHEFNVPDSVNSITIHLVSGGGGGSPSSRGSLVNGQSAWGATNGGKSTISINSKVITTCNGGTCGYQGYIIYGKGGIASGIGKLINGISATSKAGAIFLNNITLASGGDGGDGGNKTDTYDSVGTGGGSGSAAIVDITRAMLGGSKKITIVVGKGGNGGVVNNYSDGYKGAGTKGQDGSAYIEYFMRG